MQAPTYLPGDMASIQELIAATCAMTDAMDLAHRIHVQWKRRFTSRMGDANGRTMLIRLSIQLMPRATVEQRRTTIIHEVCHIVSMHKHGFRDGGGHGLNWQLLMLACGEKPERCHNVQADDLKAKRRPVQAQCGCGPRAITKVRAAKIARGARYRCLTCHQVLVVTTNHHHHSIAAFNRHED